MSLLTPHQVLVTVEPIEFIGEEGEKVGKEKEEVEEQSIKENSKSLTV